MPPKPNPTMLRRQLGAELRRLRDRTGRTVSDVAAELGWSESKLSRIETAHTGIRKPDLEKLLILLGVAATDRDKLAGLAVQSRQRAWWEAYGDSLPDPYEAYIGFEAEATSIFSYEAQVVPGLLQTGEYARAVTEIDAVYDDPEVIDHRVQVRMTRQVLLTRDPPPNLWVILDEAVLRRPIGGTDVMRRQLFRLVEARERPKITIQVLPFAAGGHRALAGAFTILEFAGAPDHPLVYSEGLTGGVFRSKPEDLRSYHMSFEALRSIALNRDDTADFIRAVANGG